IMKDELFYWARDVRSSQAEVDYVVQIEASIVPIEVKAGSSVRTKSMQIFLELHPSSKRALRFWAENYEQRGPLASYPLYAIVKPVLEAHDSIKQALMSLVV